MFIDIHAKDESVYENLESKVLKAVNKAGKDINGERWKDLEKLPSI